MALSDTQTRPPPSDDELDDILNGIAQGRDIPASDGHQPQAEQSHSRKPDATGALGVDEEIIITKKRIPIPKLNDERLLSDAGIPRLRRISKERLRFKGKGHEYGDIARMLNMYQLWLDDLYPRAKFADALTIIEKVGHTKRMHIMRKDWMNEGKPRRSRESDEEDENEIMADMVDGSRDKETQDAEQDGVTVESDSESNPNDQRPHQSTPGAEPDGGGAPDEDELDALLGESTAPTNKEVRTLPLQQAAREDDLFTDEMEAIADMEGAWDY